MASEITPTEQELLSAYLDNQLPAAERARLESRLGEEPALWAELAALRQTVTVLKAAPQLAVPRNFTLDVARYRRPTPWWARYQTMQLVGAVGTVVSILLIVAGTLLFSSNAVPFAPSAAKSSGSVSNGVAVLPTLTAQPLATQAAILIPATQTALPSATFVIPTLVPTQVAAVESAETSTAASGKFFAQSGGAAADTGAPPQQAQAAGQPASTQPAPAVIQPAQMTPTPAAELAQAQQATTRDSTALEDQTLAYSTAQPDANAPSAKIAEPTSTLAPSETATKTAVAPTGTLAPSETATEIALAPTAAPTDAYSSRQALQPAAPPVILIIGIALLVFSIMLFGIGLLRSRLRG